MSKWAIHRGDALETLKTMPDASFDAVPCDPPYGLNFMGKAWDHGVPSVDVWAEAFRVMKPGAFLLAFGGTRTFHRLTCAIEDAGFEIRDCVSWLYGSGFPKSMDISKALDKAAGVEREVVGTKLGLPGYSPTIGKGATCYGGGFGGNGDGIREAEITAPATEAAKTWNGYGTALKPAWEPCIVAMKPLDGTFAENALRHGVAGLNIEAGRIETSGEVNPSIARRAGSVNHLSTRSAAEAQAEGKLESRQSPEAFRAERPGEALGRWPANLILDPEAGAMLDMQTGDLGKSTGGSRGAGGQHGKLSPIGAMPDFKPGFGDSGGPSRFFYCAKASRRERDAGTDGNKHPCLKPLDLNRYLASLILPPERDTPRRILVPFSGSGSEMIGALQAGWDEAVGLEMEAEYVAIAEARLAHWVKSPDDFEPEPVDTPEPEPPAPKPVAEVVAPEPEPEVASPRVDDFSDLPLFGAGA